MLDVHPPHHPTHTWRDFFLHIATIVVGLLIAIGLEQSVEYVHRSHQVHRMEEALRSESLENRDLVHEDIARIGSSIETANLHITALERVRLGTTKTIPVVADLAPATVFVPVVTAWLGMRDSGLLPIVPKSLADNYWKIDTMSNYISALTAENNGNVNTILTMQRLQHDSIELSPAERDTLLLAYTQYTQELSRQRSALTFLDSMLELALDNKDVTIEAAAHAASLSRSSK